MPAPIAEGQRIAAAEINRAHVGGALRAQPGAVVTVGHGGAGGVEMQAEAGVGRARESLAQAGFANGETASGDDKRR